MSPQSSKGADELSLQPSNAAGSSHHQRPTKIRSGLVQHIWRIRDLNTGSTRGLQIDIVVTDRDIADYLQFRPGRNQIRVDPLATGRQQADFVM